MIVATDTHSADEAVELIAAQTALAFRTARQLYLHKVTLPFSRMLAGK